MDIYDVGYELGHKKGDSTDGILIQSYQNASYKCWKIFWENIPLEYHDMYIRGYYESSKGLIFTDDKAFKEYKDKDTVYKPGCFDEIGKGCLGCLGCLLVPILYGIGCYIFYDVLESVFHLERNKAEGLAPIMFVVSMVLLLLWFAYSVDKDEQKKKKSKYELFYDAMNEEYSKFSEEVENKIFGEEFLSNFIAVGALAALVTTVVTGHVGVAIAAVKVASGEELTPLNAVSAVSGLSGLTDISDAATAIDAIDTADTMIDETDIANTTSIDTTATMTNTPDITIPTITNPVLPYSIDTSNFGMNITSGTPILGAIYPDFSQVHTSTVFDICDSNMTSSGTINMNTDGTGTIINSEGVQIGKITHDAMNNTVLHDSENNPIAFKDIHGFIYDSQGNQIMKIDNNPAGVTTIYNMTTGQTAIITNDGVIRDNSGNISGSINKKN